MRLPKNKRHFLKGHHNILGTFTSRQKKKHQNNTKHAAWLNLKLIYPAYVFCSFCMCSPFRCRDSMTSAFLTKIPYVNTAFWYTGTFTVKGCNWMQRCMRLTWNLFTYAKQSNQWKVDVVRFLCLIKIFVALRKSWTSGHSKTEHRLMIAREAFPPDTSLLCL